MRNAREWGGTHPGREKIFMPTGRPRSRGRMGGVYLYVIGVLDCSYEHADIASPWRERMERKESFYRLGGCALVGEGHGGGDPRWEVDEGGGVVAGCGAYLAPAPGDQHGLPCPGCR